MAREHPGRIVVTGAAGYLGAVVAPALAAAGWDVVPVDAGWSRSDPRPADSEFYICDIRDLEFGRLAPVAGVVHLAGLASAPLVDRAGTAAWEINHDATVRMARRALAAGARRFVFASSCSLYGVTDGDATEDAPLLDGSQYSHTKAAAERDLLAMTRSRLEPVVLRLGTVYGPSPALRTELAVHRMTADAVTQGRAVVHSSGTSYRPFVHIHDVADVIRAVLSAPASKVAGKVFNVANPDNNLTMHQVAELIGRVVGNTVVGAPLGVISDPLSYRVSTEALEAAIGFRPRRSLDTGVREIAELYAGAEPKEAIGGWGASHRVRHLESLLTRGVLDSELRVAAGPVS